MLAAITSTELLSSAIKRIAQAVRDLQLDVCVEAPWHAEPDRMHCCDSGDYDRYSVVGWIVRSFDADPSLREAPLGSQRSLRATEMGFTVARRWLPPQGDEDVDYAYQREAATELHRVHDALSSLLDQCCSMPYLFGCDCSRFVRSPLTARRSTERTPYGEDAQLVFGCAGWAFSLTVA